MNVRGVNVEVGVTAMGVIVKSEGRVVHRSSI